MERNIKVIVCGGRDYRLTRTDLVVLDALHNQFGFGTLLSGNCIGVDRDAEAWARNHKISIKLFIPDWVSQGKKAGPLRNQEMADEANCCICFPGGLGTEDMRNKAIQRGIYVFTITPGTF